ncbi:MAG: ribonuclease HI, partial [Dehalococcoidia bacterium]|nr:ribonuclease HI [Dehalococcoidia bacterium]
MLSVVSDRPLVHIYSDGACSPNPGTGGWGAVLIAPDHGKRKELSGAEPNTTNNRMELMGAIMALRALKRPARVVLHTDSQYLRNAFEKRWLVGWQRNGWKTSQKQPVLNQDLWRELLELAKEHDIEWRWVPGHAGVAENERCDALAVAARLDLAAQLAAP